MPFESHVVDRSPTWGSGQIRANSSGFPESIQQNHAVARNTGCVGSALVTHCITQPRTATFYNLLTPTPIPGQLIEQPVVCRHGDAAGAPDLVCLTAQTAFGSGFFNEIFRCVDLIEKAATKSSL